MLSSPLATGGQGHGLGQPSQLVLMRESPCGLWWARVGSVICRSERKWLWRDNLHPKRHLHDTLAVICRPILGGGKPNFPEGERVQHGKVCLGRMCWISRRVRPKSIRGEVANS